MGITGILGLLVIAVFAFVIYFVVLGIKQRNTKKILLPIVGFIVFAALLYWAFLSFITSM